MRCSVAAVAARSSSSSAVKSAAWVRGTIISSNALRLAAGANTTNRSSASTSRSPDSSSVRARPHHTQVRFLIW